MRVSEEHGWELMWLATGCFAPSTNLHKEVMLFLRSKPGQVAADCLNRLQKTLRWAGFEFYITLDYKVGMVNYSV